MRIAPPTVNHRSVAAILILFSLHSFPFTAVRFSIFSRVAVPRVLQHLLFSPSSFTRHGLFSYRPSFSESSKVRGVSVDCLQ